MNDAHPETEISKQTFAGAKRLFFFIAGVMLMLVSCVSAWDTKLFARDATRANGVVTGLNAGPHHPQIEFKDNHQNKISYAQGGCVSHEIGDQVTVLYRADEPNPAACLDEPGALYFTPGILAMIGFMFVISAFLSSKGVME